jgi:uncharacterized protein YqhQ
MLTTVEPQPTGDALPELAPEEVAALSGARDATPIYGGQALLEGVMMRSPRFVAAAVRREDGEIVVKRERLAGLTRTHPILRLPFVRGGFMLWDALRLGIGYLSFAGDVLMEEAKEQESLVIPPEEVEFSDSGERGVNAHHIPTDLSVTTHRDKTRERNHDRAERVLRGKVARARARSDRAEAAEAGAEDAGPAKKRGAGTGIAMGLTLVASFAIAIGVFVWSPHALAYWFTRDVLHLWAGAGAEGEIPSSVNVAINLIEGAVRLALFLAYVVAIGWMPDIRRVFQYHGAEHKVVYAVESSVPLTVEEAERFSTIHPRCGTNFIAIAICVAVVLLSFIRADQPVLRFGLRLALLPVIAALAYEILRFAGKYRDKAAVRAIIVPGLLLQRITTRQPDSQQVEVAVRAMREVVALESRGGL